ncbi:hypothetical protein JNW90_19910 [Micromonospora sp. STR1s_5]|nr:hypothetical protein [Micromonospora sp. STR1s_5]
MTKSVPETADMQQSPKNPAERAYLLRAIARTVTESLPAPMSIEMYPADGSVSLRFDDGAIDAVAGWAQMLGDDLVQEQVGGWYWVGNHDAGTRWHGWLLHVWCKVDGTAPQSAASAATVEWPAAASTRATGMTEAAPVPPAAGLLAGLPAEFPRLIWPAPVVDPALREDEVAFA